MSGVEPRAKETGASAKERWAGSMGHPLLWKMFLEELVLLPVPNDPVEDLGELGGKLPKISLQQLRARILVRARREVNR